MIWQCGDSVPYNGVIGFDTETELIEKDFPGWRHPRLAIAQFSGNCGDIVVARKDLLSFLKKMAHQDTGDLLLVAHNAAFDYWVVHRYVSMSRTPMPYGPCSSGGRTWPGAAASSAPRPSTNCSGSPPTESRLNTTAGPSCPDGAWRTALRKPSTRCLTRMRRSG